MANTDPVEWILVDDDFTTVLGILPTDGGNLYTELNDVGSGELKIPLSSALASVVTVGMMAQCRYRGAVRGAFLIDNLNVVNADASEGGGQLLSISGRDVVGVLDDAIIWDDGTGNTSRDFSGTKASIMIDLIDEAVARGTIPNVTYDFTALVDSESVSWTDSESLSLPVGTTLLEVMRQFADTGIDFGMVIESNGDFTLQAFKGEKGSDLSSTVYFRVGTNCIEVSEQKIGTKIKNVLKMKWRDGFANVSDPTSIITYRRREEILNIAAAQSASSATTYGAARLNGLKNPQRSLPIKVYDNVTPYAFISYNIGDYITIDRFGVEASERIRGMQLAFDESGYAIITITLNDTIRENELDMGRDLDWLMKQWNTAHDAKKLEVSYWAAIGDPNVGYHSIFTGLIGSKIYRVELATGGNRIYEYDILTGAWKTFRDIDLSQNNRSADTVGTDIYIGGLFVIYKFDTLTETLSTLTSTYDTGNPLSSQTPVTVTVGTKVYFSGNWTSIGTLTNPVGIAEYDTITATWADVDNGAGGMPASIRSDGTYLYMVYANELYRLVGGSWTQVGTFPEDADNITSNIIEYDAGIIVAAGINIYYWDGSTWTTLLTLSGSVSNLAAYLTDIYISGSFTSEGNYITKYSGGSFWALDTGLDAVVKIILYQGIDNVDVYVAGGNVTIAGGKAANEVAVYFNNFEALADYLEHSSSLFDLGEAIHTATAKTPMVAADEIPLWDSITQRLRKITWANILVSIKTYTDGLYVALTGSQTIAGVKTFTSDPLIPDEAYDATSWNGNLEPPTKNAVRDKIESMSGGGSTPGGSTGEIQYNNAGTFDGSPELVFDEAGTSLYIGETSTSSGIPSHLFRFDPVGRASHTLYTWGSGLASYIRFIFARGTKASPIAAQASDPLFEIRAGGYDAVASVGNTATGAKITAVANENYDASHHGADVEIYATPAASTTITKILSILGSGHLDIGTGKEYRVNGAQHTHAPEDVIGLRFMYAFASYINISPLTATNSYPFSATLPSFMTYPKQYSQAIFIAAGTNNGSNYWTLQLIDAGTSTVIASVNTSALAANAGYTLVDTTLGLSSLTQSTNKYIYVLATKTGSPPNLFVHAPAVEYELQ